jgi:hypothetical protein
MLSVFAEFFGQLAQPTAAEMIRLLHYGQAGSQAKWLPDDTVDMAAAAESSCTQGMMALCASPYLGSACSCLLASSSSTLLLSRVALIICAGPCYAVVVASAAEFETERPKPRLKFGQRLSALSGQTKSTIGALKNKLLRLRDAIKLQLSRLEQLVNKIRKWLATIKFVWFVIKFADALSKTTKATAETVVETVVDHIPPDLRAAAASAAAAVWEHRETLLQYWHVLAAVMVILVFLMAWAYVQAWKWCIRIIASM